MGRDAVKCQQCWHLLVPELTWLAGFIGSWQRTAKIIPIPTAGCSGPMSTWWSAQSAFFWPKPMPYSISTADNRVTALHLQGGCISDSVRRRNVESDQLCPTGLSRMNSSESPAGDSFLFKFTKWSQSLNQSRRRGAVLRRGRLFVMDSSHQQAARQLPTHRSTWRRPSA